MNLDKKDINKEIEKEAKQNRKFSVDEVMSDMMGGSFGGSPIAKRDQIVLELKQFVDKNLDDVFGALKIILKRRIENSKLILAEHLDEPMVGFDVILDKILIQDKSLFAFVKQVDAEYGRMYQERPKFQKPGENPKPGDEYTHSSVRESLIKLKELIGN